MELPDFHERVLKVGMAVCDTYRLALAGGYAMRAHRLVDRESQDLDLATSTEAPLSDVVASVVDTYGAEGFAVEVIECGPRMARVVVTDLATSRRCVVDLLKEALQKRPVPMGACQVIDLEDAVGLKVRALHDRGLPRDFIDVASASEQFTFTELERLAAFHDEDFSLDELRMRLEAVTVIDDVAFEAHGLEEVATAKVRSFAVAWANDINERLAEEGWP